ncbi:MAG: ABC transporter permease [Defluviitaleaceae bacterium]|nr:ABC transporter permease [Defluviitaleaceae bacterium]
MLAYIVKRVLRSILSVFIIICIVFVLLRMLPVEGYFGGRYDLLTEEQRQMELYRMGLLDPVPVQLFNFLRQLVTEFDLGLSSRIRVNVPVTTVIADRVPISVQFGLISVAIGMPLGMALGVMMSRKKGGVWDKAGTGYVAILNAVPAPVYMVLIQLYGTMLLGAPLTFRFDSPMSRVLPIITMCLPIIAINAFWMRRYMVDEINRDYIKLAQIKNVPTTTIFFRHVFRNAVVPMTNLIPLSILGTIWGQIIIERLYSIPGMGGLLIDAILARDNALVQALVIMFSAIGIFGLLLGDLLMAFVDPRIRLHKKGAAR